jgi:hypothetical protein
MLAWQDDSANPFQNSVWMSTNPDQQHLINWNNKIGTLANVPSDFLMWSADTAGTNGLLSWYNDQATDWTNQGSNPGRSKRVLSSYNRVSRLWDPPSLFNGYRGSFPGAKRPGVPSSAELKLTSSPSICPRGLDRDNFTFYRVFQDAEVCAKCWARVEVWH